jgi:hypothetical protein
MLDKVFSINKGITMKTYKTLILTAVAFALTFLAAVSTVSAAISSDVHVASLSDNVSSD